MLYAFFSKGNPFSLSAKFFFWYAIYSAAAFCSLPPPVIVAIPAVSNDYLYKPFRIEQSDILIHILVIILCIIAATACLHLLAGEQSKVTCANGGLATEALNPNFPFFDLHGIGYILSCFLIAYCSACGRITCRDFTLYCKLHLSVCRHGALMKLLLLLLFCSYTFHLWIFYQSFVFCQHALSEFQCEPFGFKCISCYQITGCIITARVCI